MEQPAISECVYLLIIAIARTCYASNHTMTIGELLGMVNIALPEGEKYGNLRNVLKAAWNRADEGFDTEALERVFTDQYGNKLLD